MANKFYLGPRGAEFVRRGIRGEFDGVPGVGYSSSAVDSQEMPLPFSVVWCQKENGGEGAYCVFDGGDSLTYDADDLAWSDDLEDCQWLAAGWKLLEDIDSSVYLHIYYGGDDGPRAEINGEEAGDPEEGEDEITQLVASIVHNSSTGERRINQTVVGALVLSKGTAVKVDEVSIDKHGTEAREDGESDDDPPPHDALQLAHFNDEEQDSSRGLATRLKADTETGDISARGEDSLMLVARKNGKICYIPLDGEGEDPDPDPEEEGSGSECDHDPNGRNEGGVSPELQDGRDYNEGGGVPASKTPEHTGDDNCQRNCH